MTKRKIDQMAEKVYAKFGKKFILIKKIKITKLKAFILVAFALGSVITVVWGFSSGFYSSSSASEEIGCYSAEVPPNFCRGGKVIPGPKGPNGCYGRPICVKDRAIIQCPEIPSTFEGCKPGEKEIFGKIDEFGCEIPPTCVPIICPDYTQIICKAGEELISGGKDADGCDLPPSCKAQTNKIECQKIAIPTGFCKDGTIIPGKVDPKTGCIGMPTCKSEKTAQKQCQDQDYDQDLPACKDGIIIPGKIGTDGCIGPPTCKQKNINENCQNYPSSDFCKNGTIIIGEKDSNGCDTYTCESSIGARKECRDYTQNLPVCEDGIIVPGKIDADGCIGPPTCKVSEKGNIAKRIKDFFNGMLGRINKK